MRRFSRFTTVLMALASAALPACAGAQTTTALSVAEPGQLDRVAASSAATTDTSWTRRAEEFRGAWLTSADLMAPPEQLTDRIACAARANCNVLMVNVWFRGYVAFPGCSVVAQYPPMAGTDPVRTAITEARRHGMQVHLWTEYGFYAYHRPPGSIGSSMGPLLDARPELASLDSEGTATIHNPKFGDYYSLCPSNPASHALLAGIVGEALARYDADGLNLDRIRYAGPNHCFCPYCRGHFRAETGLDMADCTKETTGSRRLLAWRRERLCDAMRTLRDAARRARPGIVITSYVVPPSEMDARAQGWDDWVKRNLVDAVAVSMYGQDIGNDLEQALRLLDNRSGRLICALAAAQPSADLLANIELARRRNTLGQFIWHLGDLRDDVEALAAGPYAGPARVPRVDTDK